MRRAAPPLALLLLAGCGGRGGHAPSSDASSAALGKGRGTALLSVRWPSRGRLIPNAASSIVVRLTLGTTVVSKTLARPADGTGSTSATLTGLRYGSYTVAVNAYPTAAGTGNAQATGAGTMPVTEDAPGSLAVAMDSTAASLALVPQASSIALGQTIPVAASAKDASGAIVLLAVGAAQENLTWTAAPAASATIAGTGPVVAAKGLAAGPVTIGATLRVKDDGTVLSATTALSVSATADYRLAVGGYPKTGGDAGNAGRGGGSGATGAAGWTATVGAAAVGAVVVGPEGTVYTGAGGTVSAVSPTGGVLWQKTVAGTVSGLLLARGGALLASGARLTSMSAADGTPHWTFPDDFGVTFGSGEVCTAPNALSDGTIVEATSAKAYALDPYAKAVRWSVAFASAGGAAVASDDTVVVWNGDEVRGLAGATGAQTLSAKRPPGVFSLTSPGPYLNHYSFVPPCVSGTAVAYVDAVVNGTVTARTAPFQGTTYTFSGRATSYVLTLTTQGGGGPSFTLGSFPTSGMGSDIIVVLATIQPNLAHPRALSEGSSARFLLTSDLQSGLAAAYTEQSTLGWKLNAPGCRGASVGADGTDYLATTDAAGLVEAIDPASGAVRWTATLPGAGTGLPPAVGPDGALYAGTTDGRVVQIR